MKLNFPSEISQHNSNTAFFAILDRKRIKGEFTQYPFSSVFLRFCFSLTKYALFSSGFRHQITAAPAANQIALFSLIRFKYSTLTHQIRSPDGVVDRAPGYNADGRGIESCWTRSPKIALESYNSTKFFFFL